MTCSDGVAIGYFETILKLGRFLCISVLKCVVAIVVLFVFSCVVTCHFGLWELDDFEIYFDFLCRCLFIVGKKLREGE